VRAARRVGEKGLGRVRANSNEEKRPMRKPALLIAAAVFAAALGLSAAPDGSVQTLKGYVTDTYCGLNRASRPPTAECTVKCVRDQHAKYAFFNFADKKVYILNPQSEAAHYAGQTVIVKGTVSGNEKFATMKGPDSGSVLTATSITPAAK
jgi:hypothetical protein